MWISHLELQNFRGFKKFHLDLQQDRNLFVGINGAGKTAVLDALRIGLGGFFYGYRLLPTPGPGAEDVRHTSYRLGGLYDLQPQYPLVLSFQGRLSAQAPDTKPTTALSWTRSLAKPGARTATSEFHELSFYGEELKKAVAAGKEVVLPLFAYFGTDRVAIHKSRDAPGKAPRTLSRDVGYMHCLIDSASGLRWLFAWMRQQTYADLQVGGRLPHLDAIEKAVRTAVPEIRRFFYHVRREEICVDLGRGRVIPFPELSDGYRSLVTLTALLAFRATVLNPHLKRDAPRKTPGVVLVDEIDLSLHPSWQRRIVGALCQAFPALQFVLTTHSPQVIGSVEERSIHLLGDGKEPAHPRRSRFRDSNSILTEIMGDHSRDQAMEEKLRELFVLLDADQLAEAQAALQKLEMALGADDPELVRARAMLSFLEE